MNNKQERIDRLQAMLPSLTEGQLDWLEDVAIQFGKSYTFDRWESSNTNN